MHLLLKKTFKFESFFHIIQKKKYHNFLNWYNNDFKHNFTSILYLMKCYSKKKNPSWNKVIYKNKKKSSYNFLYRLNFYKRSLLNYNYFYTKKLSSINFIRLNNNKNYLFTRYISDYSLLFYDKISNINYTGHIDDKYYFYLKNMLFKRVKNNIKKTFKSYSWIKSNNKLFNHVFILKSKYNIFYKKIYFPFTFSKIKQVNRNKSFFYSFIIIKFYVFISKNKFFSFFKDFFIHKYKASIYSYRLRKNMIKKKDKEIWDMFFREYNGTYFGKNEYKMRIIWSKLYLVNSLLSINYLDWFVYLSKSINVVNRSFLYNYSLSYNLLHNNKLKFRKKQLLKYLVSKPIKELFFKRVTKFLKSINNKTKAIPHKKRYSLKKRKKIENKVLNFLGKSFKKVIYQNIKIQSKHFKRFKHNIRHRRKFFKEKKLKKT